MLEAPDLQLSSLASCLEAEYGLAVVELLFLPLGADLDTAVFRALTEDGSRYFLKLRRGEVQEASIAIPGWLAASGVKQLISPISTAATAALWTRFGAFSLVLYPFVAGLSGWETGLSPAQWGELGSALRALHDSRPPSGLLAGLPLEGYSGAGRARVLGFLSEAERRSFADPEAASLARLLIDKSRIVRDMISRAEELSARLALCKLQPRLCHGDIHAGNVLIDGDGRLFIVDWDTIVLAPRERDLMFIGGGVGGIWNGEREASWFYEGYGQVDVDREALGYYRLERIVQDILVTCEKLFASIEGGPDRLALLDQLAAQFGPGNVVDRAYAALA